ncbi:MAG: DUF1499 domain-containing protein [Acidobacteria bacterium]|nr:DUF1499 domain-containing protein [Acidobacteriota bacterium]
MLSRDPAKPRFWSPVVCAGTGAVALGAALLFAAALGYRTGLLDLGTSFTVLRWGARISAGAAGLALIAAIWAAFRRLHWQNVAAGVVAAAVGAGGYMVPAQQQAIAQSVPPIHDITTDTDDPPLFVAIVPLRANAPNPPEYDPAVAEQQREGYPDLRSVTLGLPPAEAFAQALAAAEAMGWELVADDAATGRIEATDTTFWYGFKDDVVIRVRPDGAGSRIDVRSKSRVGRSDVGANARRIREYTSRLPGG